MEVLPLYFWVKQENYYLASDMSKRIVIAPDSFKGSLAAREVGEALREGILAVKPDCEVVVVPLADGGEGTAEIISRACDGRSIEVVVSNPLGLPIAARYHIINNTTAVMDVASAAGLTLLLPGERNPLATSSQGVGEMMIDALHRGLRNYIIGIGGSATNDCAVGLLAALGYRFLDSEGKELEPKGGNLHRIAKIDDHLTDSRLSECKITLAVDVRAPFCGAQGAAHIFAPQKGATPEMVDLLDKGMAHFAEVVERHCGVDVTTMEGAGAAGGIAGVLCALLGATIRSGAEVVMECVDFDGALAGCDLVITGEGRIDRQTLMGKVPFEVLLRAKRYGLPAIAVGGSVEMCDLLAECGFAHIIASTPPNMPLGVAITPAIAKENLRIAGAKISKTI